MYHSHDHSTLFFFIDRMIDMSDAYQAVKANEEEAKNSKYFGLQAVKYNITLFFLTALTIGLGIGAIYFFMSSGIWQGILMILVAVASLPFMVIYIVFALNCDIKQMTLNKKPIGWVSLMFTLLIVAAAIAGIIVAVLVL